MGFINAITNWYKFLRIEHSDKNHVATIQQQRLNRLLRYTLAKSEFYQKLYKGMDIENCSFQDLPIVTKSAMMDNFNRVVTDKRLRLQEIQQWLRTKNYNGNLYLDEFIPIPTSGSSGENALVVYSRKALELVLASLYARYPLQPKYSVSDQMKNLSQYFISSRARMAAVVIPASNASTPFKYPPPLYHLFTNLKILSLLEPIDQIVEALNEFQPDRLISYSFFLGILAQEQLAGHLNISFNHPMSFLAGCSEPLTEHTKQLAFEAWNTRIQDSYGTAECFFMATSCAEFGHLHAMSDMCILEIVDRDNNPVVPGQYGEKILLTNLLNYAQPIIRYEIEDVTGYANHSCPCGLPFPTLLPIQGRTTDFMYFRKPQGGYERFHPYRLIPLFYVHDLRQYQIIQTEWNELTFLFVPQNNMVGLDQQLRQSVEKALVDRGLKSRVTLKFKKVESIPRHKGSGKFKLIKSLGPPSELDTMYDMRNF